MAKRIGYGIVALLVIALLAACSCFKEYENMSTVSDSETAAITRSDETYLFHGFVNGGELTGEQIGILDGDKNHKVYLVKGYSRDDWLISELDVVMDRGIYSLYRAAHVDDIPEDFVMADDSDSHFLENYQ